MLGFVDKRDSQINWCLISKPHLLSRGDLESNAAWKSLYGAPQIVANPASNMTTSTVNAVAFTSQRHFSGPKDGLNGKQPHLHSLTVTMSQKSSFLQPANSVSQVLIPDNHPGPAHAKAVKVSLDSLCRCVAFA
jgi:hypothetical protein